MNKRKESLISEELRPVFLPLVRTLFSMRRKTIKNNLTSQNIFSLSKKNLDEAFERAQLNGSERAEVLTFDELKALTEAIWYIRKRT